MDWLNLAPVSNCTPGQFYQENGPLRAMMIYQVAVCSFPVLVNTIFAKRFHNSTIVPPTVKAVVAVSIACNVVGLLFMFGIPAYHILSYIIAQSPCHVFVQAAYCVTARFLQMAFLFMPTFLHVVLTIERSRLYSRGSDKKHISNRAVLCCILIAVSLINIGVTTNNSGIVLSFIFSYLCFYNVEMNRWTPYCSTFNKTTILETVLVTIFMSVTEIISITITIYTYRVRIKNEPSIRIFDITQRYRRNEIKYVFILMLPYMVFHFAISFLNFISIAIVPFFYDWNDDLIDLRTVMGFTNLAPFYYLLSPILLAFLINRQKTARITAINTMVNQDTSADNYFKQLAAEWNTC